ncbi:MAG: hypothetical protein PWR30_335 [Candidatus Woesearchaeota archaeon]|nr:hypothetical protein [Candidatus Woesearchaeota archaeon]
MKVLEANSDLKSYSIETKTNTKVLLELFGEPIVFSDEVHLAGDIDLENKEFAANVTKSTGSDGDITEMNFELYLVDGYGYLKDNSGWTKTSMDEEMWQSYGDAMMEINKFLEILKNSTVEKLEIVEEYGSSYYAIKFSLDLEDVEEFLSGRDGFEDLDSYLVESERNLSVELLVDKETFIIRNIKTNLHFKSMASNDEENELGMDSTFEMNYFDERTISNLDKGIFIRLPEEAKSATLIY